MDQVTALLSQIGHFGGKVLPHDIARMARDLAAPGQDGRNPVIAAFIPQLAICLLHELGGDKTLPITTLDDLPADYILKLAPHPTNVSTPTHIRVYLEEKP